MSEERGCGAGCRGCDGATPKIGMPPSPGRLQVIPSLSDLHARYLGVVREIDFVDWRMDRVCEGGLREYPPSGFIPITGT